MATRQTDEEAIFHLARQISDLAVRAAYLDQICGADLALRQRVQSLLEVHELEQSFLRSSRQPDSTVAPSTPTERPGDSIDRYKLMERVGEGGMGIVFVAQQERPIRRKVALKVIKPGMDSEAVVARFEAERQALAMMDHPNIAKVLDAGTTKTGRPFFVMELVKGIPVTEYCDQNKLAIRDRLDLFVQVCQAIQHAHQKGIIHRDIKPSNVLVTLHDGKPVPKVIDFGIAKAVNARLTDRTVYTAHFQVVGTLLYMSPEQAELSGLDIDTRSDVYGLGVLLYELLTGRTPFESKRLHEAAWQEACRIIREEEPPKPSVRLSSLGATLSAVSGSRGADPRTLPRLVRGDLDWIVMKCLEKDRTRRYETASAFAADVHRFQQEEPIEARPPSASYRLRKLIRRHRGFFTTTAVVMVLMTVAIIATGNFAAGQLRARREAEQEKKRAEDTLSRLHDQLIERGILAALSGDQTEFDSVVSLAEGAKAQPTVLKLLHGIACYHRGENQSARQYLEAVLREENDNMLAHAMLSITYVHTGEWDKWLREIAAIQRLPRHDEHRDYEALMLGYALMYFDTEESYKILHDVVQRHPTWVVARSILGGTMAHRAVDLDNSQLAEDALRETRAAFAVLDKNRVVVLFNLWAHHVAVRFRHAQSLSSDDLEPEAQAAIRMLEECSTDYTVGAFNIATYYETMGDVGRAADTLRVALGDKDHGGWTLNYIGLLAQLGRHQEAVKILDAMPTTSPYARAAKGYLLAGVPARRDEARKISRDLLTSTEPLASGIHGVKILCLLGDRTGAEAAAKQLMRRLSETSVGSDSARWLPYSCAAFLAGDLDQEAFGKVCSRDQMGSLVFHFYVAMRVFSDGDRQGAIEHFDQATKSGQVDMPDFRWARAFRQLLANSNWPAGE